MFPMRTLSESVRWGRAVEDITLSTSTDEVPGKAKPYAPDRLPDGYVAPTNLRVAIARARAHTSVTRTLIATLADYCIALLVLIALGELVGEVSELWFLAAPVALLVVARAQRGLEALVHEASHRNWTRRLVALGGHRLVLNNWLAVPLAAAPVLADLNGYRESHRLHHTQFGTKLDSDRVRYVELKFEELDRTSFSRFIGGLVVRLPKYWVSWYTSGGLNFAAVLRLIGWFGSIGLLVELVTGNLMLAVFVNAGWLVSLMFVLPIIRFIGEAAEHVYTEGKTVFDATISNIGWLHRLLIHPHGDGYHTLHHLWQTIPHYALPRIHRLLMAEDPTGYGATVKVRTRILQHPRSAGQPAVRKDAR